MRQLIALVSFLFFAFCSFQFAAAEPLLVSGNPEAPPVVWEKSGKLVGIGPEVATRILNNLEIPFTIKPTGSWLQVQENAKNGSIDMIVAAYENDARRQYMEYSNPYLKSPVVVVVKKGKSFAFTSWNDLKGKTGVANTGESFGQEFDTYIKKQLNVTYVPYQRAFEMLDLGTADYLIIDIYPAIIYSKLLKAEDKIEFLDQPATTQFFHITISKKSAYVNLLTKINTQIEQMNKEGVFTELVKEQYKNWHKTFKERERFFAKAELEAQQAQSNWNSGARDRGLETLARFIEKDVSYMTGTNSIE